jgi:hypothetical protein
MTTILAGLIIWLSFQLVWNLSPKTQKDCGQAAMTESDANIFIAK